MNEPVGVVGAGVMGSGIAQVLAVSGHPVVCVDRSDDALARARTEVSQGRFGVESAVARGKLSPEEARAALGRLTFTSDLSDLCSSAVVIEAVPEDLALKIAVFRELDRRLPPATVLATNSSGFSVAALAGATDRPDRVIGWHWASPAPAMRLAEIVRTPATAADVVELVCRMAAAAGKHPIVVQDQPTSWGYVANRVYAAMYAEARRVVAEGVASEGDVDQLMVDCFRWPAGPFGMTTGASSGWS